MSVGDRVGEDETVVVLESMKMEIPLSAPESGVIVKLLVNEGDTVSEGTVVAVLKTPGQKCLAAAWRCRGSPEVDASVQRPTKPSLMGEPNRFA